MLRNFFKNLLNDSRTLLFFVLFSNFIFLLKPDFILIIVLVLLFSCILFFSVSGFSHFLIKEKIQMLQTFSLFRTEIKKNYIFLNKIYFLNFFSFLNISFIFWFANNLIHRCIEFSKEVNFFFDFISDIIFFIFYNQNKDFFIEQYKENFFNY